VQFEDSNQIERDPRTATLEAVVAAIVALQGKDEVALRELISEKDGLSRLFPFRPVPPETEIADRVRYSSLRPASSERPSAEVRAAQIQASMPARSRGRTFLSIEQSEYSAALVKELQSSG
jgi:hypothetical protein